VGVIARDAVAAEQFYIGVAGRVYCAVLRLGPAPRWMRMPSTRPQTTLGASRQNTI